MHFYENGIGIFSWISITATKCKWWILILFNFIINGVFGTEAWLTNCRGGWLGSGLRRPCFTCVVSGAPLSVATYTAQASPYMTAITSYYCVINWYLIQYFVPICFPLLGAVTQFTLSCYKWAANLQLSLRVNSLMSIDKSWIKREESHEFESWCLPV